MDNRRRESASVKRQRLRQRDVARQGMRSLVWLYYDQHRDAVEVDDAALAHLAGIGVAAGLSRADVHVEVAGSEVAINDGGGVRDYDGVFHHVNTNDGWIGRIDLPTPLLHGGGNSTPCPDPRCPSWGSWRG